MSSGLPPATGAPPATSLIALLPDLLGLFVAPRAAFARIAVHRRFGPAFVLAAAVGLVFTSVWVARADLRAFVHAQAAASGQPLDPAMLEAQVAFTRSSWWLTPTVFSASLIAFATAVFVLVFRFFLGAELEIRPALAVVAWTFLAWVLVTVPAGLVVYALSGDWSRPPGEVVRVDLAALLDRDATPGPLLALAEALDLLVLWIMALLSLGFSAVTGLPVRRAMWGVLGPWLAIVALRVLVR